MTKFIKEIRYDRQTRDYACYLDGELVGFAGTYHEGEVMLDQAAYDRLMDEAPVAEAPVVAGAALGDFEQRLVQAHEDGLTLGYRRAQVEYERRIAKLEARLADLDTEPWYIVAA